MKLPKAKKTVISSGVIDSQYIIIGEQPGRVEVVQHKPFVGPAGMELDSDLVASGIGRPFCYLTNVIKDLDKPIYNYIQMYRNKKLLPEPIISDKGKEYMEYLAWELSQTSAKYFMALGGVALFALTGRRRIGAWRGSVLPCLLVPGKFVIPTYHPATVIRPRNNYLNKRLIIFDLKRYKNYINNLQVPTERNITVEPSHIQSMEFLDYCYQKGLEGHRISYDIEVFINRPHRQISCISFATNKHAISIPFTYHRGDYFTIQQELEVWMKIAKLLEHPDIKICGQNLAFDCQYLLHIYGIRVTNIDDTMIGQKTIMTDYPVGLDFITSLWTDHPYYKKDGKEFMLYGGSYKKLWVYNATDSCMCDESFPKIDEEVHRLKNDYIYKNQTNLIEPLVYMMERGIKVDVKGMEAKNAEMLQHIEDKQIELNVKASRPLNAHSFKQIKEYFEDTKKIKPYASYNDNTLKRLVRKGFGEAKLIQEIRRLVKLRSTYLDLDKVDKDGRMRCSYNPAGTRYSRLSSSKNIWGTGGNLQNWPHELQNFLVADEGYVIYCIDLSQAENRIVAYLGEVDNMIECFETGKDVHSKTSLMIIKSYFGKDYEKHLPLDICPLGDGTKDWRFWGKKANHGFDYDWGYRNFALENELPENEGKLIYTAFHGMYPGVQQNFHAHIKKELRKSRSLTNLMGRKTLFLGDITGDKAEDTFKEAYSCIPQGTVGDIINKRGLNYVYYNQNLFKPVELLRQVHDDIGFQIPLSVPWIEHARILRLIKNSLEHPVTTHYGRSFVIPADVSMCNHMNKDKGKEIKAKNFPETNKELAVTLEKYWDDIIHNDRN